MGYWKSLNYTEGFTYSYKNPQAKPSKLLEEYMKQNPPPSSPDDLKGKELAKWWFEKIK